MPLCINALRLDVPSARCRDLVTAAMDEQFGLVQQLGRDLDVLGQPSTGPGPRESLRLPRSRLQRRLIAADIMRRAEIALQTLPKPSFRHSPTILPTDNIIADLAKTKRTIV